MKYLLILLLILVWGFNFIIIQTGLADMPPIFLACARFFFTCFPAIFFFKRPNLPFRKIATYSLVIFVLQFTFFFLGMYIGMTPGLTSILMQLHIFFSLILATLFFKEKIRPLQIIGALISFAGIGYAAMNIHGEISLLGFLCVLLAAGFWGAGSAISKTLGKVNMLSLVIWASMIAWPPLLLLSLFLEGPAKILTSLTHLTWAGVGSVLYLSYLATLFGYGLWSWLLHHLPLSTVAPFTLLVPVVALISSSLITGEPILLWKIITLILVVGGLSINFLGAHFSKRRPPPPDKNSSLIT